MGLVYKQSRSGIIYSARLKGSIRLTKVTSIRRNINVGVTKLIVYYYNISTHMIIISIASTACTYIIYILTFYYCNNSSNGLHTTVFIKRTTSALTSSYKSVLRYLSCNIQSEVQQSQKNRNLELLRHLLDQQ